jgi:hypothetical protein
MEDNIEMDIGGIEFADVDWIHLVRGLGSMAGSCEHGDEPSTSIKCGEFLEKQSVLLASQEGFCSVELVTY